MNDFFIDMDEYYSTEEGVGSKRGEQRLQQIIERSRVQLQEENEEIYERYAERMKHKTKEEVKLAYYRHLLNDARRSATDCERQTRALSSFHDPETIRFTELGHLMTQDTELF